VSPRGPAPLREPVGLHLVWLLESDSQLFARYALRQSRQSGQLAGTGFKQLTVGGQGCSATTDASFHHVIVDQHVQCCEEGVQFFRHTLILNALRPPSR
jgi:hypothetical protein